MYFTNQTLLGEILRLIVPLSGGSWNWAYTVLE